jgi:isoleucyl-tRNA synthetase
MLVAEHDYIHSYAYDWRTKQPVLTRATQQWFADLSELQQEAADALSHVDIIPPSGRKRLGGMVSTRKEVLDRSITRLFFTASTSDRLLRESFPRG